MKHTHVQALLELRSGAAMDAQLDPANATTVEALDHAIAVLGIAVVPHDEGQRLEDDQAVDLFAAAMRQKLTAARNKGRGGWQNRDECSQDDLSRMLAEHVIKGDPIDVANFCCFLWNRQEAISSSTSQPLPAALRSASCIGCGCTDTQACVEGGISCHWLMVDYSKGRGVCSSCEHIMRINEVYRSHAGGLSVDDQDDDHDPA